MATNHPGNPIVAGESSLPTSNFEFWVSPQGKSTGSGSKSEPFLNLEEALKTLRHRKMPSGGTIWLEDGTYKVREPISLNKSLSGLEGSPLVIRAVNQGKAVLTAATTIPAEVFKKPTDETRIPLIQKGVVSHIKAASLTNTQAAIFLSKGKNRALILSGGYTLPLACWPNRGVAHIEKIYDRGAIDKSVSDKAKRDIPNIDQPVGGEFNFKEVHQGDWKREITAQINTPLAEGFFGNDWFLESIRIASSDGKKVKLLDPSGYGIGPGEKLPRRVRLVGLLSELDEPGEWFWDDSKQTLYHWPINVSNAVEVAGSIPIFRINKANHVRLQGLVFEGASSAVSAEGGVNVIVAGCLAHNLSHTAFSFTGGKSHRILDCDIHDVYNAFLMKGTDLTESESRPSDPGHLLDSDEFEVDNNHIWHCRSMRCCHMKGIGWKFTHNLVHDLPDIALIWSGNDALIAFNEFYEVVKIAGDQGAVYTGAAWWTYGDVLRNNFVHDIYNLPEAHSVKGFYYDDLVQGQTTTGNVFYKVGFAAVNMHGGASQTVSNNVFIDCFNDVRTRAENIAQLIENKKLFDSGKLKNSTKYDYLWSQTERVVGPEGWKTFPWTKYPKFAQAMEINPYAPVLNEFVRNYENGTKGERFVLVDVPSGMIKPEPMVSLQRSDFVDPESENFALRPGFEAMPGFDPIPFEDIGLVKNENRPNPPDKTTYRREVNKRNSGRLCFDPTAKYDPVRDNLRLFPAPAYLAK